MDSILLSILFSYLQFLTELDGVEVLTGVFVFAATRLAFLHLNQIVANDNNDQ